VPKKKETSTSMNFHFLFAHFFLIRQSGNNPSMSLRDRIPVQLKLRNEMVVITVKDDVEVIATTKYILLEISPLST
jgi:hypothetical protein